MHRHAGKQRRSRADPRSRFHSDWFRDQIERRLRMIMRPGAKIAALRETGIVADGHGIQVVDPGGFADPRVIADRQAPRILNANMRLNDHTSTDFGPEAPQ